MTELPEIFKKIRDIGIMPVIKLDKAEDAVPLAKALSKGGIPMAEVTYRSSAAEASIKAMVKECPDMLVGAGTVTTVDQAKSAIAAGAKFVLAPGFDPAVVDYCLSKKVPMIPGISDASQVEAAIAKGLKVVKLFPASVVGGTSMLKALAGPFADMMFVPTGGINTENVVEYAKQPNVLAVGGSWMVKTDMINEGKWDEITADCKEAVKVMQGFKFAHMGMNATDENPAEAISEKIAVFGLPSKPGNSSIFNAADIEIMRKNGRGVHGHVGIRCANVDRSVAYLAQFGFKPVEETMTHISKDDPNSPLKFCYLLPEINGFAFHLVRY
ncbi:bifunctional 4-hydroxy-2-oxoglutarate aldolase/2-dehydro-3-deoxy-phosphogluconate aldolase [Treponema parvum]|uniref:Bifunctional 4-hydroxy-2-oxoglutarate aldolase/2-dehydro-3-deoxy-phosphogluconate aldolase n=1 Tax=Treponema parvum TaxID=138851 RepID=A0A975F4V1_9SPIR|nr:bifunctional 4-hydroxy-2-oxoglutarate aldolase/2-dehydro-3-deoxy-phosphogluconate aldolase [Treponema parvum]QTQ14735.1 bifunctional 4-hydroxy-2-oxoglutarate aldolase/2-dehydro-3-deoxy-phosphogluconate aldolase [Treponema parvum]